MVRKGAKRRPAPERDKMIVEALRGVGRPVSAYELIEELREKAILAPQTVYRSLDRLIAEGQAHRLESLNAFVACRHPSHEGAAVFAICNDCGTCWARFSTCAPPPPCSNGISRSTCLPAAVRHAVNNSRP